MTIADLMTARHAAYVAALPFKDHGKVRAWREANRQYVLVRDSQPKLAKAA